MIHCLELIYEISYKIFNTNVSNFLLYFQLEMSGVRERFTRLQEMPFSSEHKFMAVKCLPRFGLVSEFLCVAVIHILCFYNKNIFLCREQRNILLKEQ